MRQVLDEVIHSAVERVYHRELEAKEPSYAVQRAIQELEALVEWEKPAFDYLLELHRAPEHRTTRQPEEDGLLEDLLQQAQSLGGEGSLTAEQQELLQLHGQAGWPGGSWGLEAEPGAAPIDSWAKAAVPLRYGRQGFDSKSPSRSKRAAEAAKSRASRRAAQAAAAAAAAQAQAEEEKAAAAAAAAAAAKLGAESDAASSAAGSLGHRGAGSVSGSSAKGSQRRAGSAGGFSASRLGAAGTMRAPGGEDPLLEADGGEAASKTGSKASSMDLAKKAALIGKSLRGRQFTLDDQGNPLLVLQPGLGGGGGEGAGTADPASLAVTFHIQGGASGAGDGRGGRGRRSRGSGTIAGSYASGASVDGASVGFDGGGDRHGSLDDGATAGEAGSMRAGRSSRKPPLPGQSLPPGAAFSSAGSVSGQTVGSMGGMSQGPGSPAGRAGANAAKASKWMEMMQARSDPKLFRETLGLQPPLTETLRSGQLAGGVKIEEAGKVLAKDPSGSGSGGPGGRGASGKRGAGKAGTAAALLGPDGVTPMSRKEWADRARMKNLEARRKAGLPLDGLDAGAGAAQDAADAERDSLTNLLESLGLKAGLAGSIAAGSGLAGLGGTLRMNGGIPPAAMATVLRAAAAAAAAAGGASGNAAAEAAFAAAMGGSGAMASAAAAAAAPPPPTILDFIPDVVPRMNPAPLSSAANTMRASALRAGGSSVVTGAAAQAAAAAMGSSGSSKQQQQLGQTANRRRSPSPTGGSSGGAGAQSALEAAEAALASPRPASGVVIPPNTNNTWARAFSEAGGGIPSPRSVPRAYGMAGTRLDEAAQHSPGEGAGSGLLGGSLRAPSPPRTEPFLHPDTLFLAVGGIVRRPRDRVSSYSATGPQMHPAPPQFPSTSRFAETGAAAGGAGTGPSAGNTGRSASLEREEDMYGQQQQYQLQQQYQQTGGGGTLLASSPGGAASGAGAGGAGSSRQGSPSRSTVPEWGAAAERRAGGNVKLQGLPTAAVAAALTGAGRSRTALPA